MKKNQITTFLMLIMGVVLMTVMASCTNWPFKPEQKSVETVVVAPIMIDANLYQGVITRGDTLQTEYSVYVYAKDKWDAERSIMNNYIQKETIECSLRVILITPINDPFKYENDSTLLPKKISQTLPVRYIKRFNGNGILRI